MEFFSSLEEADPAPTWTDTVETDDSGKPRADGATLKTRTGSGPSTAHTAKTGVGFTGVRSLRYQGTHAAEAPAYAANKVFWVEHEVDGNTELSYVIFPERHDRHSATYVSVDLAFDDGTYLSELGAVDQLGYELSPRAQGESKALYPNQWNYRAARIGQVASGKKITKILVAYDAPEGPATFGGWIDDIAIASRPVVTHERPSDYVITTRGTNSNGSFSRGNCFPATAVPHGFNFWTPITNAGVTNWFYEYHRANNAANRPELQAFGVSHLPSPWMGDRHTFQVMPSTEAGRINPFRGRRALSFQHANEIARPHYYSVEFDNGVRTEIAPADHAAIFRFTFPGKDASLIFDNVNYLGRLKLDQAAGTISGYTDVRSGLSVGAGRMFVYATFDRRVTEGGRLWRGFSRRVTGFLRFAPEASDAAAEPTVVTMRIATSLISLDQAKRNLALEISAEDTLEEVRERAQSQWDELLGRVEVEGANEDQLTTLYSNLYRLFLYPNRGHENTGSATRPEYTYASPFSPRIGPDTPTQSMAKLVPGKVYVNNGFWDTYRTCWPAYALLTPSHCGELIDGFVQHYRDGGWISRWSSPGYANLMTGTSSDVAFADAYLKGVTNFDVHGAYEAALRNATTVAPNASVGRKGLDPSIFFHYTPTSTAEGLSWTLEGCVNDFGIANLAQALGDTDNHGYFLDRARHYVNAFDHNVQFFQGRDADYTWRNPPSSYDPRVWGYDYVETDGWNTAFSVPHDGRGLANLYGGRNALADKLDEFFATPETGRFVGSYRHTIHEMTEARDLRMGQYGHSNQPSHHVAWMYAHAGKPFRVQEKVREVLARAYAGSQIGQGYCGDEDNGEMSAWWLFAALGFYPLAVGSPYYVVGSPLFTRARVRMDNGRTLVINAPNNSTRNIYVHGLRVNGQRYDKCYLSHETLAAGAVLDFLMGPEPSRWGSRPDAAPPSITAADEVPLPLHDITGSRAGTASWSGGGDPGPVFDDTGREATFATPTLWIRYSLRDSRATVQRYTLTSGSKAGDPRDWVLEASNDGHTWTVLDERANQEFQWRRQTRAFPVTNPGEYGHYRLRITANSGERTVTMAELELLAR
jgi:predicted alpha-1,2-mannosidase